MTTQELQLNKGGQVTLNASGTGTVKLGPTQYGQRWKVTNVAVATSTAVNVPECRIYLGPPAATSMLGGSFSGNQDTASTQVELLPGQYLTAVWTGGDSGAVATLSLYGTRVISGG